MVAVLQPAANSPLALLDAVLPRQVQDDAAFEAMFQRAMPGDRYCSSSDIRYKQHESGVVGDDLSHKITG